MNLAGRVGSSQVTRPDPWGFKNILTRPDLTREVSEASDPT